MLVDGARTSRNPSPSTALPMPCASATAPSTAASSKSPAWRRLPIFRRCRSNGRKNCWKAWREILRRLLRRWAMWTLLLFDGCSSACPCFHHLSIGGSLNANCEKSDSRLRLKPKYIRNLCKVSPELCHCIDYVTHAMPQRCQLIFGSGRNSRIGCTGQYTVLLK